MTILVSFPKRPPSPVSFSPPVRARSVSSRSSCSSAADSSGCSWFWLFVTSVTGVSSISGVTPLRLQSRPMARATSAPALWQGQCGSAGVDRGVVNDEGGLQRDVFGAGELEGERAGAAAQRVGVLGVAAGVVEVGERGQRGAVGGDGELVELGGGGGFGGVD